MFDKLEKYENELFWSAVGLYLLPFWLMSGEGLFMNILAAGFSGVLSLSLYFLVRRGDTPFGKYSNLILFSLLGGNLGTCIGNVYLIVREFYEKS
jgi:cytosine/uracil/thiamine/allantoin permease